MRENRTAESTDCRMARTSWWHPEIPGNCACLSAEGCTPVRHWPAMRVDPSRPIQFFDERHGEEKFPIRAVQYVEVTRCGSPQPAVCAAVHDIGVDKNRGFHGVVVKKIVRRELEIPLQLSGVRVESQDAIGVQIVSRPRARHRNPGPDCWFPSKCIELRDRKCRASRWCHRRVNRLSPGQLSEPGSPGAGIVQKRQTSLPVSASYAATNPRTPSSPPEVPTSTLSFTTRGALVAP